MTIQIGGFKTLAGGKRYYAYSGLVRGDVTNPPDITLVEIKSTGLKDSFLKIQPTYGRAISHDDLDLLGLTILIDDVEIFEEQRGEIEQDTPEAIELFVPRQSKLTVKSINTSANNIQERGVVILGWYL